MKLRNILAATAALSLLVPAVALAQAKDWSSIKIATEGAYKPWNFTDASGKLIGFEVDLAEDLCKRMKAKCEIVAQAFDGMIPALNTGKYDAIMAGMNITDKRKEAIAFTEPYGRTPSAFAVLKSGPLTKLPEAGKVYSLNTPKDLLSFGPLPFIDRLRMRLMGMNARKNGLDPALDHIAVDTWIRKQVGDRDIRHL